MTDPTLQNSTNDHEFCVAEPTTGRDNVIIGHYATSKYNRCVVVGDHCESTHDDEVVVGNTLFGKPIPPHIQESLRSHPEDLHWVRDALANAFREPVGTLN